MLLSDMMIYIICVGSLSSMFLFLYSKMVKHLSKFNACTKIQKLLDETRNKRIGLSKIKCFEGIGFIPRTRLIIINVILDKQRVCNTLQKFSSN